MQINYEVQFDSFDFTRYRKDTRFGIPKGLTKKEYKELLKDTQKEINDILQRIREVGPETGLLLNMTREDYVEKKKKLNAILKSHQEWGDDNLKKAKAYPIEQLIEFDGGGFAKCLWHQEKTGSLKWYRERNKAHCFGGCGDFDSIDVYMKINNVTLPEAIKQLTR